MLALLEKTAVTNTVLEGFLAFVQFASGPWPFKGRKAPKNPYPKDTAEHGAWLRGYDGAFYEWNA